MNVLTEDESLRRSSVLPVRRWWWRKRTRCSAAQQ